MSVVLARSLAGLALAVIGLVLCVATYRRTCNADLIVILLGAWFAHSVVYYLMAIYWFATLDPYPLDLARAVNTWSTALRFQIALALIGILIWHPARLRRGNG